MIMNTVILLLPQFKINNIRITLPRAQFKFHNILWPLFRTWRYWWMDESPIHPNPLNLSERLYPRTTLCLCYLLLLAAAICFRPAAVFCYVSLSPHSCTPHPFFEDSFVSLCLPPISLSLSSAQLLIEIILKYQPNVPGRSHDWRRTERTHRLETVCSMRNIHLGPVPASKTIKTEIVISFSRYFIDLDLLDSFLCGHVAARIEGIRRWSRVYIESRLDSHAQRHHWAHLQAHRTPTISRRLILAPLVLSCADETSSSLTSFTPLPLHSTKYSPWTWPQFKYT